MSLVLTLCSLTSLFSCELFVQKPKDPMPAKDVLYANLENAGTEATYTYSATYLEQWGFSYFESVKLKNVEYAFRRYYVEDIPSPHELALTVAYDFLDNKYDEIDITDLTEVTTAIIDSYVEAIGDDYAIYRLPDEYQNYNQNMSGEITGIGITLHLDYKENTMTVSSVLRDSPAQAAGFEVGDVILAVDGKTVTDIGINGAANAIRGEAGTDVTITVRRGDSEINITATRAKITERTVYYEMLENNIGYIEITAFKANTALLFEEALDDLKGDGARGIIFDLRSNGGGYLYTALDMIELLVPEDVTMTSYTYLNNTNVYKTTDPNELGLPCVVLCNAGTASAAELFTSAIRDYGEMGLLDECIVGNTTYGKGIMQNTYSVGGGSTITMTIAYYYTPLFENYHGVGIIPDVEADSVDDADKIDEQLNAAIDVMMNKLSAS